MIQCLENKRVFHLQTQKTSMIIGVLESGHLACLYWGNKVSDHEFLYIIKDIKKGSYLSNTDEIDIFKLEQIPLLYPAYGNPDMRTPAYMFEYEDGSRISDFRYHDYCIYNGKKKLAGMPTVLSQEANVLELQLVDNVTQLYMTICFSVFEDYNAITQSIKIENRSQETIVIDKIMSSCWSFLSDQFHSLTLTGAWGRECHIHKQSLQQGLFVLDSKRGASGHGQNPFIALMDKDASEYYGNIYAMNFVYSGNFEIDIEVDMHQNTRLMMGINSFDFKWNLQSSESFETPEVVMIHSGQGLHEMTNRYHHLYVDCLMQSAFAKKERPILINNWEATYFDFNKDKIMNIVDAASHIGIELFVLDDGWYGLRNDDKSSLGDWYANEDKLGGTLAKLADEVNQRGLKFGLWIEPEMVSPNSNLYRNHPEWIIRVPKRVPQQARYQYVLDLTQTKVQDYIIDTISTIIDNAHIEYIKWDMNRNITDIGSLNLPSYQQKEVSHRYILGLYRILETITNKYKHVLFEGCAGGGGRTDPGILYYMPQIWVSDDSEAIDRLDIQRGNSLVYPQVSMGCHVSSSPNHQNGRKTSLNTRGIVAMEGNFGYELDLSKLNCEEIDEMKEQVSFYKQYRKTLQFGELFILLDSENEKAWMKILGDEIIVSYIKILTHTNIVPKRLKLKGLENESLYCIDEMKSIHKGNVLMNIGLDLLKPDGDFFSQQWVLHKIVEK
ncbi:MAG: alpha-galactosidase [Coprobacillus sp.]